MFPIPFNFPFRKKDGSITTMDDAISSGGGSYELPTASPTTKGGVKVGAGLTMDGETLKNTNPTPFSLPIASAETLGGVKVGDGLTIEDGVLSTSGGGGGGGAKVYYKEFTGVTWETTENLAKFENNAAVSSSYSVAKSNVDITVSGYTPIAALAIDVYAGYRYTVGIERTTYYSQPVYRLGACIGSHNITTGGVDAIVYYVKNEDLEQLT